MKKTVNMARFGLLALAGILFGVVYGFVFFFVFFVVFVVKALALLIECGINRTAQAWHAALAKR